MSPDALATIVDANELERETIRQLSRLLPSSHHITIVIRHNAKNRSFEGDWLKRLLEKME